MIVKLLRFRNSESMEQIYSLVRLVTAIEWRDLIDLKAEIVETYPSEIICTRPNQIKINGSYFILDGVEI